MNETLKITGVILAGGQGRRMGEKDKGLIELGGLPLISHITNSLQSQCNKLLINANRNKARYSQYGYDVISDEESGFQGPLAGMAAAMKYTDDDWIITVPCDGPYVATDYVARMRNALQRDGADIAVARDEQRLQPVYALIRVSLLPDLEVFLKAGERKIERWFRQHKLVEVDFIDSALMFENFNTPEQLQAYHDQTPDALND
jgi:molybdenum cofactor guanylyltransferase